MTQEQLKVILNVINESVISTMKKFEETFPEYREASEKSANLYDFVIDILENDETEITIKQKRDILSYLDNDNTAEMYAELIFYLKGMTDGIKLIKYFE